MKLFQSIQKRVWTLIDKSCSHHISYLYAFVLTYFFPEEHVLIKNNLLGELCMYNQEIFGHMLCRDRERDTHK